MSEWWSCSLHSLVVCSVHTTDVSLFSSIHVLEVGLEGTGNALLDVDHLSALSLGVDHIGDPAVSSLDKAEPSREELIVEVISLRFQPTGSISGILNRAVDELLQFVDALLRLTVVDSLTAKRGDVLNT